jgi:hypothetical protein
MTDNPKDTSAGAREQVIDELKRLALDVRTFNAKGQACEAGNKLALHVLTRILPWIHATVAVSKEEQLSALPGMADALGDGSWGGWTQGQADEVAGVLDRLYDFIQALPYGA